MAVKSSLWASLSLPGLSRGACNIMNVMLDSAIVMRNLGRGEGTRDDDDSLSKKG